jgi:hypothetical protein
MFCDRWAAVFANPDKPEGDQRCLMNQFTGVSKTLYNLPTNFDAIGLTQAAIETVQMFYFSLICIRIDPRSPRRHYLYKHLFLDVSSILSGLEEHRRRSMMLWGLIVYLHSRIGRSFHM